MSSHEPIAIVGMSCRLPGAMDTNELWEMLIEGKIVWGKAPDDRCNRPLYFDPSEQRATKSYTDLAGVMPSLDVALSAQIKKKLTRTFDIAHQIFLEQTCIALADAGQDPHKFAQGKRTGVYVGHTGGSSRIGDLIYSTCIAETARLLKDIPILAEHGAQNPEALALALTETVRSRYGHRTFKEIDSYGAIDCARIVQHALGLDGPTAVFDAACASGLQALSAAMRALRNNRIDQAIVGAVSHFKVDSLVLFSAAHSVSRNGSFPLCEDADGLVTAEGQVALVLKPLSKAQRDGDRIHAVIEGLGMSSDGKGKSLWAPRSEGQLLAMQRAYANSNQIRTLGYIEAHATGTQVGDTTELQALNSLLERHLPQGEKILIGSLKTNIGHTLETAGLASLVKLVLAMEHGWIPLGSAKRAINPALQEAEFVTVPREAVHWPVKMSGNGRRGAVNAFGIGGINAHVVVSRGILENEPYKATYPKTRATRIISSECILPGSQNKHEFLERTTNASSALSEVPSNRWSRAHDTREWPHQPFTSLLSKGGFVQDYAFDWRSYRIPPLQIAAANPLQYMFIEAVDRSLRTIDPIDPTTTAVIVGTKFGGDFSHELQIGLRLPETLTILESLLHESGMNTTSIAATLKDYERRVLTRYPALLDETGSFTASSLATRVAKIFNFMGGAFSMDAGLHTTAMTLAEAEDLLREGACDTVICAIGQRHMDLFSFEGISLEIANESEARPASISPDEIDKNAPGEGVVVFVLKRSDESNAGMNIESVNIAADTEPEVFFKTNQATQSIIGNLGNADAAVELLYQAHTHEAVFMSSYEFGTRSQIMLTKPKKLTTGKVAAVFPGQGSQYENCFKSLVERSPLAAHVLADLDELTNCLQLPSLAATAWHSEHSMGTAAWSTQWAVFLSDMLAWRLLQRLGIKVDCVAGHSFGEFPMAVATGAMTFREAALASQARAAALEKYSGEPAGLTSIAADTQTAELLISTSQRELWLSAMNSPRQSVIGGTLEALTHFENVCDGLNIAYRRLAVGSAFHTPLLNRAALDFSHSLKNLGMRSLAIPAFSATTGKKINEPQDIKSNFLAQMTQPVRWVETVKNLYDDGVRTFIEVGPASVLSGLIKQILHDCQDIEIIPMDLRIKDTSIDPLDILQEKFLARGLLSLNSQIKVNNKKATIERFDASAKRRERNRQRAQVPGNPMTEPFENISAQENMIVGSEKTTLNNLHQSILDFVVEHTGYPVDMIDFNLNLEADLGIDSIRKAQLISELGARYHLKREPGLALSDFACLRDIEEFFAERLESKIPAQDSEEPAQKAFRTFGLDLIASQNPETLSQVFLLCLDRESDFELVSERGAHHRYWLLRERGREVVGWNEAGLMLVEGHIGMTVRSGSKNVNLPSSLNLATLLSDYASENELPVSDTLSTREVSAFRIEFKTHRTWTSWEDKSPVTELARFVQDEFTGDWNKLIAGLVDTSDISQEVVRQLSAAGRWLAFGLAGGKPYLNAGDSLTPERAKKAKDCGPWTWLTATQQEMVAQRYVPHLIEVDPRPKFDLAINQDKLAIIGHGEAADSLSAALGPIRSMRGTIQDLNQNAPKTIVIADKAFLSIDDSAPFSCEKDIFFKLIPQLQAWLHQHESDEGKTRRMLAVVHLGGDLGVSGSPLNRRASALVGLLKALALEYPNTQMRVIDIGDQNVTPDLTQKILGELSCTQRWTEVAVTGSSRQVIQLHPCIAPSAISKIQSGETWMATGGASGITAECMFALAKRYRIKVALVGKTPLADQIPDLKNDFSSRQKQHKQEQIKDWLARYAEAGLDAAYFDCDLGNKISVEGLIEDVEKLFGSVRGIVHGAGVEHSARFAKKSVDSFCATLRPKNLAIDLLIEALKDRDHLRDLHTFVAFGSTSGFFGGHGQADYSMANQLLARQITQLRHEHPDLQATCFHWHAWNDVGMATRSGIPLILEKFGLKLMPAAEGVRHFLAEIDAGLPEAEVVITEPKLAQAKINLDLDSKINDLNRKWIISSPETPHRLQFMIDGKRHPFLYDHRLEGVPLLPAAMAIEFMFQSAQHAGADLSDASLTDFTIAKPIFVAADRPSTLDLVYLAKKNIIQLHQDQALECSISSKITKQSSQIDLNTAPKHCPFPFYPTVYIKDSSLRHGPSLQTLRGTYFDRNGGWGELIAPDPALITAPYHLSTSHIPVALLDGCFFACGVYAYFLCGQRIERPIGMKEIKVARLPSTGEKCLLNFTLLEQHDTYSLYDLNLFDHRDRLILRVHGLRMGRFQ